MKHVHWWHKLNFSEFFQSSLSPITLQCTFPYVSTLHYSAPTVCLLPTALAGEREDERHRFSVAKRNSASAAASLSLAESFSAAAAPESVSAGAAALLDAAAAAGGTASANLAGGIDCRILNSPVPRGIGTPTMMDCMLHIGGVRRVEINEWDYFVTTIANAQGEYRRARTQQ